MLTQNTAAAIHNCHQQIINAEKLVKEMREVLARTGGVDLIDAFGRKQRTLELGVPSGGQGSYRIFNVDPDLGMLIIDAQVLKYKSQLEVLNELAKQECLSSETTWFAKDKEEEQS